MAIRYAGPILFADPIYYIYIINNNKVRAYTPYLRGKLIKAFNVIKWLH
jgi:hypothetical protein